VNYLKEPSMNHTEEQVRRLFALATEDLPPEIDLLRGMRARHRARRMRTRVALSTATAGVVATVLVTVLASTAVVTLSVSRAPSALAQVIRAATRMAAQSYHYTATITDAQKPAYGQQPQRITSAGEFDPVRRVGEESRSDGTQVRVVGGYIYFGFYKGPDGKPFNGKPWSRSSVHSLRVEEPDKPALKEALMLGVLGYPQTGPQGLVTLLKSASQVREAGRAYGPGWTGVRYVFSGTTHAKSPLANRITHFRGTVDVDRQGRVRQVDATFTRSLPPPGSMLLTTQVAMSFGDFGAPVSVTAPPRSETAILSGQVLVFGG
jgi:hypothetical protein